MSNYFRDEEGNELPISLNCMFGIANAQLEIRMDNSPSSPYKEGFKEPIT